MHLILDCSDLKIKVFYVICNIMGSLKQWGKQFPDIGSLTFQFLDSGVTPIIGDSASNGATGMPLQQLVIYDSFEDCWFAKHCTISVIEMSRQTDFQKL